MIRTDEHLDASPETVFAVLCDPAWYPDWLVGAKHIRGIDEAWPAIGAAFHHTVGVGPLRLRGSTSVLAQRAPRRLDLRAGIGPLGAARVRFVIEPDGDGSRLTIEEEPDRGIVRLLWSTPARPLLVTGLWGRNVVSMSALRDRIEAVAAAPSTR
jgi:carbon monoxide dehydrogenase subunit G